MKAKRPILIEMKFGSHLYGTNTPASDLDLKGVFLPSRDELLSRAHPKHIQNGRKKKIGEKNTNQDVDFELFSLDRFVELLLEGQTIAFDMLFCPDESLTEAGQAILNSDSGGIWRTLRENRERFLSRGVSAFVGYARKQASKFGVKGSRLHAVEELLSLLKELNPHSRLIVYEARFETLKTNLSAFVSLEGAPVFDIVELEEHENGPLLKHLSCAGRKAPYTIKVQDALRIYQRVYDSYGERAKKAKHNDGIDWKALSHAVRVNEEAVELLLDHRITFPLKSRELILKIKKGEIPFDRVSTMIETGLNQLIEAQRNSSLPAEPDRAWAEAFVSQIYSEICGCTWPLKPTWQMRIKAFGETLRLHPIYRRTLKPLVSAYKRFYYRRR